MPPIHHHALAPELLGDLLAQLPQLIPQLGGLFILSLLGGIMHMLLQLPPFPPIRTRNPLLQPQTHHSRRLVHQIHRLIRPAFLGQIPPGHGHCRRNGPVGIAHLMELLKLPLKPPEDLHGLPFRRLRHLHLRKPPAQGRVPEDIFPVFLPGGSADHLNLAPAQGRL